MISRVISDICGLVFEAFTEVRHLSQVVGTGGGSPPPRGRLEFRAGGEWEFSDARTGRTDYQEWIS